MLGTEYWLCTHPLLIHSSSSKGQTAQRASLNRLGDAFKQQTIPAQETAREKRVSQPKEQQCMFERRMKASH